MQKDQINNIEALEKACQDVMDYQFHALELSTDDAYMELFNAARDTEAILAEWYYRQSLKRAKLIQCNNYKALAIFYCADVTHISMATSKIEAAVTHNELDLVVDALTGALQNRTAKIMRNKHLLSDKDYENILYCLKHGIPTHLDPQIETEVA